MQKRTQKRKFLGIWIPSHIWLAEDLTIFEKVFLVEIQSLDNEKNCFATNNYFAKFFGLSVRQVQRYVTRLEEKGYVKRQVKGGFERFLMTEGGMTKMSGGVGQKRHGGYDKNVIHNNTGSNIVNKKIILHSEETSQGQQENEVIDLFKSVNPSYKKFFANITQRKSVKSLLKQYGFNKVAKMIEFVAKVNGKKYAPVITTPVQLEDKLGLLLAYYKKESGSGGVVDL